MEKEFRLNTPAGIQNFRLPRFHEIPDVGLYLEQTTKYICGYLDAVLKSSLTASMISNYVKKGLIDNPVKKQYSREQIAYLIFIALAKNVLSLDALQGFIQLQKQSYTVEEAYNYFAAEFENILLFTFGYKDTMDAVGMDSSTQKRLLFSCIAAVTQIIYLENCLEAIAIQET